MTWDPKAPNGCRVYRLKSKRFPALVLREELGEECIAFENRTPKKNEKDLDLNDPSLW
jgi:hypothetical protein